MDIPDIISMVGVGVVGLGLIGVYLRNGRHQARRDGGLEERLDTVSTAMNTVSTKVDDVKEVVVEQRRYCAGFTARIDQRVTTLEKRVTRRAAK